MINITADQLHAIGKMLLLFANNNTLHCVSKTVALIL